MKEEKFVRLLTTVMSLIIGGTGVLFVHCKTGVQAKDMTIDMVPMKFRRYIEIMEPDTEADINYWAEKMMKSKHIVVADSVYFHICCALGRKPDFAWFQRGKYTFERVKPLHMDVSDIVKFP